MNRLFISLLACFLLIFSNLSHAHVSIADKNLKHIPPPSVPGLLDGKSPIIIDKKMAIQLGKSLFWDTNVGSNGVACATCHFHAGADRRVINQLNPGALHLSNPLTASEFSDNLSGITGPNYQLQLSDFPFYRFENPDNRNSNILFSTDDVVGSSGVYSQSFQSVSSSGDGTDLCTPTESPIFHVGAQSSRQTTKRNAPTVINAIFNRRNFWDGRANHYFNGTSPFGPRDPDAKIWVVINKKAVAKKISLKNASLASQAVGPPQDMIEMSCNGRKFKDIAQKILPRKPLEFQEIHSEDSVLAEIRDPSGLGLLTTYDDLIKKSFNPIYWSKSGTVISSNGINYSQMEANFSFFFGLAIQMYEETLVSNDAPIDGDLDENDIPKGFTELQKKGLGIFADAHCDLCHSGPVFTAAKNFDIVPGNDDTRGNTFVDRIGFTPANSNERVDYTISDIGFFNTSVVPDEYDVGLGGTDPWGNPLSYTEQYVNSLQPHPKKLIDKFAALSCNFTNPFTLDFKKFETTKDKYGSSKCKYGDISYKYLARVPKQSIVKQESLSLDQGRMSTLTKGAFKIPTLRNVELTGPYMHNGSMKSLEEVVEFYNRGGNVHNRRHPDTLVFNQNFSQTDKEALVAFLKTLTDERVRWEKAPFDHPSIKVPEGHYNEASATNNSFLEDRYILIPAVGKSGLPVENGPLMPFDTYLK